MTAQMIADLPKIDTAEQRQERARRRRRRRMTPAQLRLGRAVARTLRRGFAKFFLELGHAAARAA
jgi:hypothetical protein